MVISSKMTAPSPCNKFQGLQKGTPKTIIARCRQEQTAPRSSSLDSRMFAEEFGPGVVPRLLSIVEPRVVWQHMHSSCQTIESSYCFGHFFTRKDGSNPAIHGVYEGCYWKLLSEAEELRKTLVKLARAPEAAELPVLSLAQGPNAPSWESFAPALQQIAENPPLLPLVLPAFRSPLVQVLPSAPHTHASLQHGQLSSTVNFVTVCITSVSCTLRCPSTQHCGWASIR
jgi:hypothetical protein